jgi:NAD(P)-dependent dehydrogenase (short-subunit alcohol dehydrogenase family)
MALNEGGQNMSEVARTALVTGATSGIGQWIALGLLRAGYRVLAVGRDAGRLEALRRFVKQQSAQEPELLSADLASLDSVRRLVAEARRLAPSLHVLVNNAGLIAPRRELTADGIERTLAVNHVAPFLLVQELLGALQTAGAARVVNVGSTASDRAIIAIDDLQLAHGWSRMRAYGQSKLALMIATFELARRTVGSGVTANVVHPGLVGTRIGNLPGLFGLGWSLIRPLMLTPRQGADTPLFVATDPSLAGTTGLYFKRRAEARPNAVARNEALAERLWQATEQLTGPRG